MTTYLEIHPKPYLLFHSHLIAGCEDYYRAWLLPSVTPAVLATFKSQNASGVYISQ